MDRLSKGDGGDEAEFEDIDSLRVEADELKASIAKRLVRIEEINEKRKWNIDNICKVKEEKTIVNKIESKSLAAKDIPPPPSSDDSIAISPIQEPAATPVIINNPPAATPVKPSTTTATATTAAKAPVQKVPKGIEPSASIARERMSIMTYNDFVLKHENILETYSEIADLEATKEYLFKHCDILLHEHSQSYMLLSSLEDEMNGKKKRMKLVCRQSQILSHIQELGVSMKRDPRDVVLPFFKRIEEKAYFAGFQSAVEDFIVKIQKRAVEKRKEMDEERLQEQRARNPKDQLN